MSSAGIVRRLRTDIDLESMKGQDDENSFAWSTRCGERNSGQAQRIVGEHNIFVEALSQALGGSKITVMTLCPGSDRNWNGSWHEPRQHAQHDDYGCKVSRLRRLSRWHGGELVHVTGIANELAVLWIKYQLS